MEETDKFGIFYGGKEGSAVEDPMSVHVINEAGAHRSLVFRS
jgi:hypothetical protein